MGKIKRPNLSAYFVACQMPKNGKKGVSNITILVRQLNIRKFFRWLYDDANAEIINWMKITIRPNKNTDKTKLLTPEEVKTMVSCCSNKREACMIMIGYECALRAGELVGIRLKDIIYDNGKIQKKFYFLE